MTIEIIPISDSTSIDAIGYDSSTEDLIVIFKKGGKRAYTYHNVSVVEFTELMIAPSKGSFIALNIKPSHSVS